MSGVEIATKLLDDFTGTKVKELLELRPWMKDKRFILLTKQAAIEKYINECIEKGIAALDLETTGLNTRINNEGESCDKIVGICLSHHPDEGIYICVAHEDAAEYNVSLKFILSELSRLAANCILIFHNFKYDGQLLRNYGIIIDDYEKFEDTYLMAAIEDASRKDKKLKYLSEVLLDRPQLEIQDMGIKGNKKNIVAFEMVPPQKAVYYGGGDGMNTVALYLYFKDKLDKVDPTHIYRIEKMCLLVTMEMERNLAKVDIPYLQKTLIDVDNRIEKLIDEIYDIAGHQFDLNSTQQLGNVLFNELKLPYPKGFEKTKTGHHQTNEEILKKIDTKNPIVDLILIYRAYIKVKSTYLLNMINNADENDEIKFQLNQVQADTGRFSGTGGKGLNIDGYSGVNCQNIPKYDSKDPHSINLRRAIIARPGYKIVSIDYSGEELRIAANFSKEPKWVQEFLHGTGDLHTITGQIITGKKNISYKERSTGKTLNFLTMYGGGAGGFAAQAKIPYTTAKKMIINFFKEYSGLNSWIKSEWKASRERKYSRTAFGRRRPLKEFYDSQDRGIQSKGDRCAINSAIQGTGADIIKIALWRVYKWIKENNLQDDIKILLPVHDEIVYEIKEDKLDLYIPELCNIMKIRDLTDKLKWVVPLEVDAEYGDSFHVDHNYWEEKEKKEQEISEEQEISRNIEQKIAEPSKIVEDKKEVQENIEKKDESIQYLKNEVESDSEVNVSSTFNEVSHYYKSFMVKDMLTEGLKGDKETKEELNRTKDNIGGPLYKDAHIKERIDISGFFNYPIEPNIVVAQKLRFIFETIKAGGNSLFIGPKYKICILNKRGVVLYKSSEEISIDAFLTLCLMLNI